MTRLTRSQLFVPASKPAMIQKAAASAADVVCIDLEDSVTPNEKAACRAHVIRALKEIDFGRRVRMFRINALDSPFAYRDLVEVVEAAGDRIDLVMVPKVGSARDVQFVDTLLTQIEAHAGLPRPIGIEVQIETAHGFLHAREIASASPRLEALIFGAGDFAASMRMPSAAIGEADAHDAAYPGHRWHSVMQTIVAAARVNGLRALDGPYAGYSDSLGLDVACRVALAMGFDGKQCIHPAQLAAVNDIFAPSDEEVTKAAAVVRAYDLRRRRRPGRRHPRGPDDRRRQRAHGAHDPRAPTPHRIVNDPNGPNDSNEPNDRLPLDGTLVVAVEQAVAAPFASRQLADLGARVIKIERPGTGDFARGYDRTVKGLASHFVWINRTKESLTLDLKQPEGAGVLRRLLSRADVLIHNLAPGAMARLGFASRDAARAASAARGLRDLRIRHRRPLS